MTKKQQVLFVGYILWGGGQEKVMYYLSHYLDRAVFEPHAAYLVHRDNLPIAYDPSIPLYCLDPNMDAKPSQAVTEVSPRKQVGARRWVLKMMPRRLKDAAKRAIFGSLAQSPVEVDEATSLLQAVLSHDAYARRLQKVLSVMDEDAIIVAFQEGPTVQAWLQQVNGGHRFFSYLCAPESIYLPRLYPDAERYMAEKWMFSNACRSALGVTVPNDWMSRDMETEFGVPSARIKTIPNPIDCRLIAERADMPPDRSLDLGRKTVFVQLARMDPQKNHDLTVAACEQLAQRLDDFVVLIIGDGPERSRIEKMARTKGLQRHLVFLGAMGNPYPLLKRARASILTSHFEASPLVLLESMFLGAVPVSVDCIAGPAEQLDSGRCGLLVPPDDPAGLANAMYKIATDQKLWLQLREGGMQRARSFDVSDFIGTWTDMLLEAGNR